MRQCGAPRAHREIGSCRYRTRVNLLRPVRHFTPIECKARQPERDDRGGKKPNDPAAMELHRYRGKQEVVQRIEAALDPGIAIEKATLDSSFHAKKAHDRFCRRQRRLCTEVD